MSSRNVPWPVAILSLVAGFAACSSGSANTASTDTDGSADSASSSSSSSGSSGSSGSTGASSSSGSGLPDGASGDAANDAGEPTDAQTIDGDAGACSSCAVGSVCVEDIVSGGALFLVSDAGQCPSGRIPSGGTPNLCVTPPTYHCAPLPAGCNTAPGSVAVAHCTCAPALCPTSDVCADPTPTLMTCSLLAP